MRFDVRARGPVMLVVLTLIPVVLWARAGPLAPRFSDTAAMLTSIGVSLGLAGVSAFALNLVLGARLRFIDGFFGGLDKMFRVHQANGRVAFAFLLGHATFIVAGRAVDSVDGAARLLTPAAGWTVFVGVLALAGMTVAIVLTLYARLGHEMFVYVQRSFGFVFVLAALHVFNTPGTKAVSPPLTFYLAGLSLVGLIAFAYRSLLDNVLVKRHDYLVSDVRVLDEDVMEITMTPEGERLKFKPGQFLFVTFYSAALREHLHPYSVRPEGHSAVVTLRPGDIAEQFHPFSITSTPAEPDVKIVFKRVGDYTAAMRSLDKGARARVEGPYGSFSYVDIDNPRQVWIAGGVGITPFLSMARDISGPDYEIDFYYSMRSIGSAYLMDEFVEIARAVPNFNVIPYPEDELGFITADVIERRSGGLEDKDVLICGPPPMIDALRAQLHERGVPKRRVHYEKFGFAPKPRGVARGRAS